MADRELPRLSRNLDNCILASHTLQKRKQPTAWSGRWAAGRLKFVRPAAVDPAVWLRLGLLSATMARAVFDCEAPLASINECHGNARVTLGDDAMGANLALRHP